MATITLEIDDHVLKYAIDELKIDPHTIARTLQAAVASHMLEHYAKILLCVAAVSEGRYLFVWNDIADHIGVLHSGVEGARIRAHSYDKQRRKLVDFESASAFANARLVRRDKAMRTIEAMQDAIRRYGV